MYYVNTIKRKKGVCMINNKKSVAVKFDSSKQNGNDKTQIKRLVSRTASAVKMRQNKRH